VAVVHPGALFTSSVCLVCLQVDAAALRSSSDGEQYFEPAQHTLNAIWRGSVCNRGLVQGKFERPTNLCEKMCRLREFFCRCGRSALQTSFAWWRTDCNTTQLLLRVEASVWHRRRSIGQKFVTNRQSRSLLLGRPVQTPRGSHWQLASHLTLYKCCPCPKASLCRSCTSCLPAAASAR